MNFKRKLNKLKKFKEEMNKYSHIEKEEIESIIKWRNRLQKNVKTVSKIINLNQLTIIGRIQKHIGKKFVRSGGM